MVVVNEIKILLKKTQNPKPPNRDIDTLIRNIRVKIKIKLIISQEFV